MCDLSLRQKRHSNGRGLERAAKAASSSLHPHGAPTYCWMQTRHTHSCLFVQCRFCLNFQLWTTLESPQAIQPVVWNMTAVSWQKVARIASLQNTTNWDNSGSRWQLTVVLDVYRLLAWLYLQQRMMRWKLTQALAGRGFSPRRSALTSYHWPKQQQHDTEDDTNGSKVMSCLFVLCVSKNSS